MMKKHRYEFYNDQRGMTLVELIVAMLILGFASLWRSRQCLI
ncbi:MAG: type II secretion system protein [Syntrophomonadaceae bacterium]|nr:type II secretion system protein [Syntrophomonadaceae bacterium]